MKKLILGPVIVLIFAFSLWLYFRENINGALPALVKPDVDVQEVLAPGINNTDFKISVPDGYQLSVVNNNFTKPRVIIQDPEGRLIISDPSEGSVYYLDDKYDKHALVTDLNNPHGIVFSCDKECHLYVADRDAVYKYTYDKNVPQANNKQLIAEIPQQGRHSTKYLLISENKLFISVGSSCDTCLEEDFRRATVLSADLDGSNLEVYSSGLRNAVYMAKRPGTNQIWVTEMGRDFLGDDLPPDEINVLQKDAFYGWPYCYGKNVLDTTFDSSRNALNICNNANPSHYDLQAHSAPLGIEFIDDKNLLVAFHGSWNRTVPTGYKIVKLKLDNSGEVIEQEDFLTGWLNEKQEAIGRPAGILQVGQDIYITDDKAGVLYLLQKI